MLRHRCPPGLPWGRSVLTHCAVGWFADGRAGTSSTSPTHRARFPFYPGGETWQLEAEKMEIIPVHETKRMLKRPGSTVEIAVLRTEPRNGNLHPQQVSEKPHACEGHGLRFHLPRRFCPEPAGELLLVPRCLHQGRPAELHVCQQLLTSLSTSPQTPRAPLHPSFPLSIPCLGTDPYLCTPQVSYRFTSVDLSSPVCILKHRGFSIPGDPQGKSCISRRKPISRYSLIAASLPSPYIYSRDALWLLGTSGPLRRARKIQFTMGSIW